jgi:hypothetical protein
MRLEQVLIRPLSQMNRPCEKCYKKMEEKTVEVRWFLQGKREETRFWRTKIWYCNTIGCWYGKICFKDAKRIVNSRVWIINQETKLNKLISLQTKDDGNVIDIKRKQKRVDKKKKSPRIEQFDQYGRFKHNSRKKYDWGDDD